MQLKYFIMILQAIKGILYLSMYLFFLLFLYDTYLFIQKHNEITSHLLELSFLEKQAHSILILFAHYIMTVVFPFILKILIIGIGLYFYHRVPILNRWIAYWEEKGNLTMLLGRNLTDYLRYSKRFNIKNFLACYNHTQQEQYYLYYHQKKLHKVFNKYDPYFSKEKI